MIARVERALNPTGRRQLHRVQLRVVDDACVLAPRRAKRRRQPRVRLLSLVRCRVVAECPGGREQRHDQQDERAREAQPQAQRMRRVRAERPAAGGRGVGNRRRCGREAVEQALPPGDHQRATRLALATAMRMRGLEPPRGRRAGLEAEARRNESPARRFDDEFKKAQRFLDAEFGPSSGTGPDEDST